jgi:sigma-B regulation protein RsbU (phosphoserine phosphatase)
MYGMWGQGVGVQTAVARDRCLTPAELERSASPSTQANSLADTLVDTDAGAQRVKDLQAEVAELRRQQAVIYRSFFEAAQVQRRLCAPRELRLGEYEIAGEIFPVRHLSGDFFKVIELDSALGVIVGDIAGKGLSAGIWMPHLISLLHSCALANANPAAAIAQANRELCAGCGQPPLVAAFFARIDLRDGAVEYCDAGLPSPLILHRAGEATRLDAGGPMLGAVPEASYQSGRTWLNPGDTLLAYSDGLTECENAREEEFETARLLNSARAFAGASASQMLFSTLGAVMDFADGQAPLDDLTLLVVRRAVAMSARGASRSASPAAFLQ